jgi:hypothetical protein
MDRRFVIAAAIRPPHLVQRANSETLHSRSS